MAADLARQLAEKFLGGQLTDRPLANVSELAINESSLTDVQEYIRMVFEDFEPSEAQRLIPAFRWMAIATTNYDQTIEKAYDLHPSPLQSLVVMRGNTDRVEESLRNRDALPYLKLHGCITRTSDPDLPLILTPEHYQKHRHGRSRLFMKIESWGYECPIVFIGHSLQDPDLQQMLSELSAMGDRRPRYYLVSPGLSEPERRLWESRRFTVLDGTFEEFIHSLNRCIPENIRGPIGPEKPSHPIETIYGRDGLNLSQATISFLENDAEYVHIGMAMERLQPTVFYRGHSARWSPIEAQLDVRRKIVDDILMDVIIADEVDRPTLVELCLIHAEAGAGKSVLLQRVAWESAKDFQKPCIFLKGYGRISYEAIREISDYVRDRLFLFVDDAADRKRELLQVITKARQDQLRLTIITAERGNEWNIYCDELHDHVTTTYQIKYLSNSEITDLVHKLTEHHSLGHLEKFSFDDRIAAFANRAGRQLLVALHEATEGKPFEDILVDEYNQIKPLDAQQLYLSVCILNRLGIPVRAGLISRVHNIPFSDFSNRLFKPLEHVVFVEEDTLIRDHLYSARHSEVANIVFDRILTNRDERFDCYARLLAALDTSYSTDNRAFRRLIRARTLLEIFNDHEQIVEIFKIAQSVATEDSYLYQQRALYEMYRPNGNLNSAHEFLTIASRQSPHDRSVIHSSAELARIRAEKATTDVEKDRYRDEAKRLALSLIGASPEAHGYHTLLKVIITQLQEAINSPESTEREIEKLSQEAERYLNQGLQRFPGDEHLLSAESELGRVLRDEARVLVALQKAFSANRRSPNIARQLSRAHVANDRADLAIETIKAALEVNRGDRSLNFALAELLIENGETDDLSTLLYHLRRSFTPGDDNLEAQFWYARFLFEDGQIDESKELFARLRAAPMSHERKTSIKSKLSQGGRVVELTGEISRLEATYGFVIRSGIGDEIFMHADQSPGTWQELRARQRVRFELGFNFGGPIAINVTPLVDRQTRPA